MAEGSLNHTYRSWLSRPYLNLDLSTAGRGPLHVESIRHAFGLFVDPDLPGISAQRALPAPFRKQLVRQTGLSDYDVSHPLGLPGELGTGRWRQLCDAIRAVEDLTWAERGRLGRLLNSLCFYQVTLDTLPEPSPEVVRSDVEAAYAADLRAVARYVLNLETGRRWREGYRPDDVRAVAETAPPGSQARFNASLRLLVYGSRTGAEAEYLALWRRRAEEALHHLDGAVDPFTYTLASSRFYRGAAYEPFLRGDKEQVLRDFQSAEAYARQLTRDTRGQQFLVEDNLSPLLETQAKVAAWVGDFDLALEKQRDLVALDPLDPIPHLELGEVLMKRGEIEAAAAEYCRAASVGPPSTEIGLYMAGRCYEKLGQVELATSHYLATIEVDPGGISPLVQLRRISRETDQQGLRGWVEERMDSLTRAGVLPSREAMAAAAAEQAAVGGA